jgi:hypothetical protein
LQFLWCIVISHQKMQSNCERWRYTPCGVPMFSFVFFYSHARYSFIKRFLNSSVGSVQAFPFVRGIKLFPLRLSVYLQLLLQYLNLFTQSVGLLGQGIIPSQGHYLHREQHKRGINAHTDIHPLNWIRTHDPSVWAGEDSSCLRPRGHCDRLPCVYLNIITSQRHFKSGLCKVYVLCCMSDFCTMNNVWYIL